ncbi:KilA-N domain-containing protein [Shewanella algae]|uniref:KilA-N domain-containing protein n=1 Tax=Shewanella algae TaxID=38313 RepID=UPI003003FC56
MTKKFNLERAILGGLANQDQDGMINMTQIIKLYNDHKGTNKQLDDWWRNNNTDNLLAVNFLANHLNFKTLASTGFRNALDLAKNFGFVKTKRGKYGGTYMHPALAVHCAEWLDGAVHMAVTLWYQDNCVANRAELIDLTKEFTDAIKNNLNNPTPELYAQFQQTVKLHLLNCPFSKHNMFHKLPNFRNALNEQQLKIMNDVHRSLALLIKHGFIHDLQSLQNHISKMDRFF